MPIPQATARLQLHRAFTLDHAAGTVEYYAALGVSHLYLSPIFTARPGSTHGYDVTDPTAINPELGGEPAFRRLSDRLRRFGMGMILDIVPNHMAAVSPENGWWEDVLRCGPRSAHASVFDIEWEKTAFPGKVLLPILGRPYGEALAAGDVRLEYAPDCAEFHIAASGQRLPLAEESKSRLSAAQGGPGQVLLSHDSGTANGRHRLHTLLEAQHYRLAWWRCAADELNWRRFFEISELVGVKVERPEVFELTHSLIFRLLREGLIDGVRVDHVDGLADPAGYCRKLRQRLDELGGQRPDAAQKSGHTCTRGECGQNRPYLIVEKILADGEQLRPGWGVDGTTGYEFMNEASAVLHDPDGEAPLTELWSNLAGTADTSGRMVRAARRQLTIASFSGEFDALCSLLKSIADTDLATRDISAGMLRRALAALLEHFRVYRTYVINGEADAADATVLEQALAAARRTLGAEDHYALEMTARWLGGVPPAQEAKPASHLQGAAVTRFQQLTSPLAAKSLEDTVFYRYGRLLSRNEVGSDPQVFSISPESFHRRMAERARSLPFSMLATATHDHKRGEDARARLAVLSEVPRFWADTAKRWLDVPDGAGNRATAPDRIDSYMLLQTLVGAWPYGLDTSDSAALDEFIKRVAAWQTKALREAKRHTSWIAPDAGYEEACGLFLLGLAERAAEPGSKLRGVQDLVSRLAPAGAVNSLAQTVIRLTAPGVPDLYQGTELWDFSLVDPDNRRPVDFNMLAEGLKTGGGPKGGATGESLDALLRGWKNGRIKQAVIHRLLQCRKAHPALFENGEYLPLRVCGKHSRSGLAYMRQAGERRLLVTVSRLAAPLLTSSGPEAAPLVPAPNWGDTALELGDSQWQSLLDGRSLRTAEGKLPLGDLLAHLPVAVLLEI